MSYYTIFNKETGKIKQCIYTENMNTLMLNIKEKEDFIIGEYSPNEYYIDKNNMPKLKE